MNTLLFKTKKKESALPSPDPGGQVIRIPLDCIYPNPSQPRRCFDEVDIVSLADSIRQHGLLQPITVRRSSKNDIGNDCYYVIAGERRLRAFRMLGKQDIPCLLVDSSPLQSAELAIIENIMRKDLNLFEYAKALDSLIEKYDLTQEELAAKLSTSQSNIANKLRLLRFTSAEQQLILDSALTERHARSLLRISDVDLRLSALHHIAKNGLNVKKAEEYIDTVLIPCEKEKTLKQYDLDDFCQSLSRTLSQIEKKGILASSEREETDCEIRFIIRIPKNTRS